MQGVDRDVCLRAICASLRFYRDLLVEISRRDGAIDLEHSALQSRGAQHFAQRCGRLGRFDACHTAEVDGTFAFEARAAIDFMAEDAVEVAER